MKKKELKEVWKEFPLGYRSKFRYAISNFGNLVSFTDDIKHGRPIKGGTGNYYKIFLYSFIRNDKRITKFLYFHHLVAAFFLPNKPEGKASVLHIDHDRLNNRVDNLQWCTEEELVAHKRKDPRVIGLKMKHLARGRGNRPDSSGKLHPSSVVLPGEEWKEISMGGKMGLRYAISDFGRIMSFVDKFETGRILKPSIIEGYKIFNYRIFHKGKSTSKYFFIRKLVAKYFLPPPTPDQTFVLYLDHNKNNNRADNLRWATKKELYEHTKKSPNLARGWLERRRRGIGRKLTSTQVQLIKLKLFDPNRKTRLKILAKQYGISEMALQRIKTGENWGYVKVKLPAKPAGK